MNHGMSSVCFLRETQQGGSAGARQEMKEVDGRGPSSYVTSGRDAGTPFDERRGAGRGAGGCITCSGKEKTLVL